MVFILDFLEGDMFVAPPLQQDMPEKLSIAMPVNQRHLNAVAALSLSTTHVRHDSLSLSLSLVRDDGGSLRSIHVILHSFVILCELWLESVS